MLPNVPGDERGAFRRSMAGAVLNALNIRLDASSIAFMLDHGGAKVHPGRSRVCRRDRGRAEADEAAEAVVIDVDDTAFSGGKRIGEIEYESRDRAGRSEIRVVGAWRRMGCDRAELHLGHHGQSRRASSPIIAAPISTPSATSSQAISACIRSISGPCRCSTATAGASRGRWRPRAGINVCLRKVDPAKIFELIPKHGVTHMCGAPIVYTTLINAPIDAPQGPRRKARRRLDRRRRAAGRGDRGRREHRHQADPRLWPDRSLRPRLGLRGAAGLGRSAVDRARAC